MDAAKQPPKGAAIKSAIYYLVLVILVLLVLFYSQKDEENPSRTFGPFAYHTVLTKSMQSVYPKGSLILSWDIGTAPISDLKAGLADGTDIVFMNPDKDVIVHRIIEIYDEYEDMGLGRGFVTQGTNNPRPDVWSDGTTVTLEPRVIGRVIYCIPYAGDILAFIGENVKLFIGGIAIIFVLSMLIKIIISKDTNTQKERKGD